MRQALRTLRWIDYARRSMQRLGFLKIVIGLASKSRSQTLESLTRAFHATVTKKTPVLAEKREAFERYVREQQLHRRYRADDDTAEAQDLYLSDPGIPSHSGAITGDLEHAGYRHSVYVEIPTWATRLHLIRDQNYTLTDRGRVLGMFGPATWSETADLAPSNPLAISAAERYVCLFALLEADGDLLTAMYRNLIGLPSFSRTTAGDAAVSGLEELRANRLKRLSAGPLLQARARVDRTLVAVKNQKVGGLGPRESLATPRTEPFVDCGILTKTRYGSYEYAFSDFGKTFLRRLIAAPSVTHFLEDGLAMALSIASARSVDDRPDVGSLARAYTHLKSGLGYVSLRELAVAASAEGLLSESAPLFEIAHIEEALRRAAGTNSRYVRLAHGRSGGVSQVRIDPRVFSGQ